MSKKKRKKVHAPLDGTDNQAICSEITDVRVTRTISSNPDEWTCQACIQKLQRKQKAAAALPSG
jgi:hypothetical protein